ncbi:TauD/TfdA dioxygenase family protein [Oscillatoria salina]|uniref:TauD/TfdA dioxygenase family protein n=1 Tax=Oscillatoria salina TaxID=331517 RepID=UPI0013BAC82B|nr:TauD/TfdA family dioxygenase [Oscillatoria salina]MBZ8183147.1 TauD/TfdA family dioxygenase [Oscillatoria salina IIICB1]NET91552.1 TauD/TfdA family dioxygenase [Kamptonema sp. SIO1D9]
MSNLQFTENENGVGVTVHYANLAASLSPHHTLQIRQLLNCYRLVIFPNQNLTDEHLSNFAFRFGPPFVPDNSFPVLSSAEGESTPVVIIGNQADDYPNSYLGFQEVLPHSDHQWLRCPSSASLLYAVDITENSSPTIWFDMARAYTLLDRETRDTIQDLRLITYNPFYRPFGSVSAKYVDRRVDVPPGATFPHPLVRTHPETREQILYLNAAYEIELVGIPYDVGSPLIARLHEHIQDLEYRYEHQWQNGDLVLWDNQATLHYRPAFDPSVRRVLKRVTIGGGIPY